MEDVKKKTVFGFIYKFLERVGAKGISFVISLILARVLMPEQYGIIALVTVFITVCDVFVTYGFGNSLVINKNSDSKDFSTCFYFSIVLSIVVYVVVYNIAPLLADFYGYDILTSIIRIMALRIPISAINSIQNAYVEKQLMFRKFFFSTLIGTFISGILAVIMAYKGYGVWALVAQFLGGSFINTLCLAVVIKWKPTLEFSLKRLKNIYSYGWKILLVGLLDTGYSELRSLIIGKKYSSEDLAYYNKGNQFPGLCMDIIESTISGVLFPALSKCNDDLQTMKEITRKTVALSTYLVFPIMIGLFAVAEPLVILLLTDKWIYSVVYLRIGCIALIFRPLQIINNSVIRASGKSGLLLKLNIIKKSIGMILLLISMFLGVEFIALSLALTNIISTVINIIPNRKILNYGYKAQFTDVWDNMIISLLMGIVVISISLLKINIILLLFLQIFFGIVVYIGLSIVLKNKNFKILYKTFKSFVKKY